MKHQFEALPKNCSIIIMADLYVTQLDNKFSCISLKDIYIYIPTKNVKIHIAHSFILLQITIQFNN